VTEFIESFATQQMLPPYRSIGARVTTVMFALETGAIARYCDRFFNLGDAAERGVHYQPLSTAQFGIVTVTEHPSIASTNRSGAEKHGVDSNEWDHLTQTELYVAVPVMRYRVTAANLLVDPEVRWFQPIVVIDNATSTFGAREILGVEALWGELRVRMGGSLGSAPGSIPGSFHLDAILPSWRVFEPNCKQEMLPFLTVETGAAMPVTPSEGNVPLSSLTTTDNQATLDQLLEALPQASSFLGGGGDTGMRMVTLKQFRDAYDPAKAIYQALAESTAHYHGVRDLVLYDRASVKLSFTSTAMVREIVGTFLDLKPMTVADLKGPVDPLAVGPLNQFLSYLPPLVSVAGALSFTTDLEFGETKTIHTFPVG
jgi:hypothetical protein